MKIIFCLPGKTCSAIHRNSWIKAIPVFHKKNIEIAFRDYYSSDIYLVRNVIVRGKYPEDFESEMPFGGMDYDFMMWIDSDNAFNAEDVLRLTSHDVDVVGGVCRMSMGRDEQNSGKWGYDKNGNKVVALRFPLSKNDKLPVNEKGLFEVDFIGFSFLLVKRGVFEKIGYPYFRSRIEKLNGEPRVKSEDTSWCLSAKECGYRIFVDLAVEVLHDNTAVFFEIDEREATAPKIKYRLMGLKGDHWGQVPGTIKASELYRPGKRPKGKVPV